ncbi:MAG TPA: ribosome-associated translation inhibitor RaiA [Capillimicrobium sp.]|nr:ribosome-associated translation inhibitor RaiA [Capillimicrobium sp.]
MQIAIKGRGITVSDELRERVSKRFAKVDKQVSDLARLEVELRRERNPAIPDSEIAEVTLYLKGVTLRACERARDVQSAINLCADDLARQVKRHRVKRRRRREARAASAAFRPAV